MFTPDLDLSRRFLQQNPPTGEVLLVGITGSHHYGFPSPDSDIDIKGIHIAPTQSLLGLGNPLDTHDALTVFEGVECDLTTNEAGKAMSLLLRGNGNMLERIFSPFQVLDTPHVPVLRALATGSLSKQCFNHYFGYFKGMQREHLRDEPHAKSLLYTYRVAMTGIHLLTTGKVVAHLPTLAPLYGLDCAQELIDRKTSTCEKVVLTAAESEHYRARWVDLEAQLHQAFQGSPLPEHPGNRQEVNDWLVIRRLEQL